MPEVRLRIAPEFDDRSIRDFLSQIEDTVKTALGDVGEGGGGGGVGGRVNIGAGGIGKIAGIGALAGGGAMAAIEMLIKEFKPLATMVQQIVRMLMQFLRPIAEFIMIILEPIMNLIRPLLTIFNAILAPYRSAAMQLAAQSRVAMAEGDIGKGFALSGLSAATILKPITDLLMQSQAELLKLMVDVIAKSTQAILLVITAALGGLASIFSEQAGMKIAALGGVAIGFVDQQAVNLKDSIDAGMSFIMNESNRAIEQMARGLGAEVILPTIAGRSPESLFGQFKATIEAFGESSTEVMNTTFDPGQGFIGAFTHGMDVFGRTATQKIKEEMERIEAAVRRAESAAARANLISREMTRTTRAMALPDQFTPEAFATHQKLQSQALNILRGQGILGGGR